MYQEYLGIDDVTAKKFYKHRHHSLPDWEFVPDDDDPVEYIVKEYIGNHLIDYYKFDDFKAAETFMNERNSKTDNDFRAPECQHVYTM